MSTTTPSTSTPPFRTPKVDPRTAEIPDGTWLKFHTDGTPKSFEGNTLICHLLSQCAIRDAVTAYSRALRSSSFASKLALLPEDSFHMTVFDGATGSKRTPYSWPADVDMDASVEECNEVVGRRFRDLKGEGGVAPLNMRADGERLIGSVSLVPADEGERQKLRRFRDRLADEVFNYRRKTHETYEFHISLSYQLAKLTEAEEDEHKRLVAQYMPAIVGVGVFELGLPEYCTYPNMYRFDPVYQLRP